jgi:hypothetical protein
MSLPHTPPLNSILSLVPDTERADAWQLITAVMALEGFVRDFGRAVELFNLCAFEAQRVRDQLSAARASTNFHDSQELWREKRNRFSG